ncbi:hypothetical protein PAXINDRAFT_12460 [Paxillus involutus ATCC 200175]|uniref:Uncharacterized protein n=1 Tax=Paxillus involutus ATCC 200175 TaxID=664439 RepID=A0A0C9TWJ7_PAXIN|nr:hypothetical protein PAXINDRAFT_12460 [Paxillus involutus ATCC 200175]
MFDRSSVLEESPRMRYWWIKSSREGSRPIARRSPIGHEIPVSRRAVHCHFVSAIVKVLPSRTPPGKLACTARGVIGEHKDVTLTLLDKVVHGGHASSTQQIPEAETQKLSNAGRSEGTPRFQLVVRVPGGPDKKLTNLEDEEMAAGEVERATSL